MKRLSIAFRILLFFILLTGIIYPVLVTGVAQIVFPSGANGSLIVIHDQKIGSKYIGQQFESTIYFTPRPSAISYNPLPSGGSNYGLTNVKLINLVSQRKQQFIAFNQLDSLEAIPSEMLFASASGLDPHISQKAALLQVNRIANARNFNPVQKQKLVQCIYECTEEPQFLVFGEERINVLVLNLELNNLARNIENNR
jgi:potassium-transporting ATPase KdpC subunit